MSTDLALVCKSYSKDRDRVGSLIASMHRFNTDHLPLVVSVPQGDLQLFAGVAGDNVSVVADESYAGEHLTTESLWGLAPGYVNQEICKLNVHRLEVAQNYLFVDSDLYFIRPFSRADFLCPDGAPLSVLVMDKNLLMQDFYRSFGAWRTELINKIFDEVEYFDGPRLTCHGMTVVNSQVLADLKSSFMDKHGYGYADLLEISPYEFTWYNAWLQKSQVIPVRPTEPFFKTYHMRKEYMYDRLKGITEAALAQQYCGIVLNSNWEPKGPPSRFEDPSLLLRLANRVLGRL